ncbi:MAG: aspartoacylase, partial [Candidatus Eisenbacteria bacterium]|nr:aspartoacylase [Candidatus Eisenbacteria bacterium]
MGGIHGNEPAGVLAAERVLQALEARQTEAHGTFIAFRGNTRALAQQIRYLEDDLNRMWSAERVQALQTARDPESASPESQELLELLSSLNEAIGASDGPVYLLDLHTTSADGAPFATIGDTLRNRKFARSFPLPVILGLEEQIDGPMLEYMNDRGVITMGVEGGQHDSPKSIDTHEAVLWNALVRAGVIAREEIPNFQYHRDHLRSSSNGAPGLMAIRYRHDIKSKDKFVMDPG